MISANIRYRYGDTETTIFKPVTCELEFFDVDDETRKILEDTKNFIGSTASILNNEELKCSRALYDKNNKIIEGLERNFQMLRKKHPVLLLNKKAYLQAKSLREQIKGLTTENGWVEYEISSMEQGKEFTAEELVEKYRQMLFALGFKENMGLPGLNNEEREVFTSSDSNEQMKKRAFEYYNELSNKLSQEIANINVNYGLIPETEDKIL